MRVFDPPAYQRCAPYLAMAPKRLLALYERLCIARGAHHDKHGICGAPWRRERQYEAVAYAVEHRELIGGAPC